ncbi:probable disease resistance protein At5g66900 [Quercus lobata]|uniref:probable disease resistance protein At5g66900 n=1 Tax=Quercus lobata TaxID=97700 RepID=UPI0012455838|nr:probable disease resistance protein At5g66900 [Quercus lobata]
MVLKMQLLNEKRQQILLTAPGGCGKTTLVKMLGHDQEIKYVDLSKLLEFRLKKFMFDIPNYNILVTSRTALPGFSFTYYLNPLNDDHATMLLHHSASLQHESSNIPVEAINKIVRGCGGFPLALEVIGRLLDENPVEAWCSIAKNWSNSHYIFNSSSDLLDCLRKSLEFSDHKVIFKERFMDLELHKLDEVGNNAIHNLHKITTRNLANLVRKRKDAGEINKYYNEDYVTQHDLLRELAIFESCQGPKRQRQRLIMDISRNTLPSWCTKQAQQPINARLLLILTDESFSSTWCNIQAPKVEVLVLNFQTNNYSLPAFVDKMDNLKREMASGDDGTERWCVVIGGRGFAARHLVEKLISYNMFLVRIADMGPTINLDPHEENGTLSQALRSAQAVYVSMDL